MSALTTQAEVLKCETVPNRTYNSEFALRQVISACINNNQAISRVTKWVNAIDIT